MISNQFELTEFDESDWTSNPKIEPAPVKEPSKTVRTKPLFSPLVYCIFVYVYIYIKLKLQTVQAMQGIYTLVINTQFNLLCTGHLLSSLLASFYVVM